MMMVPLIEAHDLSLFGGKAISLGAALRARLPVPDGVALAAPFVAAVARNEAPAVAALASLPTPGPLAVRSSAVGEDSADASFAGQHVTRLNVDRRHVQSAVSDVWASARCDAALAYRRRHGLPPDPRVGVILQAMVEPVAAGVLFTRNPITGADERLIEATWGLGEAVVNGTVVPDRFRLDPAGTIIESTAGDKDVRIDRHENGGTVEVAVTGSRRTELCLRRAEIIALFELAEQCRRVWGPDLDLEWAVAADGRVWLLQCRPITTGVAAP